MPPIIGYGAVVGILALIGQLDRMGLLGHKVRPRLVNDLGWIRNEAVCKAGLRELAVHGARLVLLTHV